MLQSEGKRVLLHCVQAQSRMLTVVMFYGSLLTGAPVWKKLLKIRQVLMEAQVNRAFERELRSHVSSTA